METIQVNRIRKLLCRTLYTTYLVLLYWAVFGAMSFLFIGYGGLFPDYNTFWTYFYIGIVVPLFGILFVMLSLSFFDKKREVASEVIITIISGAIYIFTIFCLYIGAVSTI